MSGRRGQLQFCPTSTRIKPGQLAWVEIILTTGPCYPHQGKIILEKRDHHLLNDSLFPHLTGRLSCISLSTMVYSSIIIFFHRTEDIHLSLRYHQLTTTYLNRFHNNVVWKSKKIYSKIYFIDLISKLVFKWLSSSLTLPNAPSKSCLVTSSNSVSFFIANFL